ncbi:hypothetical protein HDU79_005610 [Rhizoclosmatium sp. JEL0117]|nr:hypothetical protein HDU79_005610 [Rhizoclosmatium sp. JEL0117]
MSFLEAVTSRKTKDWLKALLAYVLTITFIFSPWNSWIQPRSFSNVVLIAVIQSPAKTVGNFLDSAFLLLIAMCISSAIFAFMQAVAGDSYAGLAVILFIVTYLFATLRTFNIARYFVFSLVGPLFAFSACTSLVGVSGKNTTNGAQFDENFLVSTIKSYLIGLAICTIINIFVFPDFAEPHINEQFLSVLENLKLLSGSILSSIEGSEIEDEEYAKGNAVRAELVAKIQQEFGLIDANISQASAEIVYSHFSIKDYNRILKNMKSVAAVLFSIQTTLSSAGAQRLLRSPVFAQEISDAMKGTWQNIRTSLGRMFADIEAKLNCASSKRKRNHDMSEQELEEALLKSVQSSKDALVEFEQHNPAAFFPVFAEKSDIHEGVLTTEIREGWDKFLQVTFFILGAKELVKELTILHSELAGMGKHLKVRLHFRHFLPSEIFKRAPHHDPTMGPAITTRMKLSRVKDFFLSSSSIFGLKCAAALVCLQMILFNRPDIFKQWYLNGAVTSLLVAISPSMGQTYLGLPFQVFGSSLGALLGYAAVKACGKTSYGVVGFAVLVAIPGYYLQLKGPATFVLGLLMLMSFSTYVSVSNANSINPLFDSPELYLGKTIGTLTLTLSFAVVFSLILYPTLARRVLREKLAEAFIELNVFYRKILLATVNVPESVITIDEDDEIKECRNQILTKLLAIETLMVFAAAEPRLEAKFASEKYRAVLTSQYRLLDRMECLRMSGGGSPFDVDIRKMLNTGDIGKVRIEMQKAIRLLLYVFASTMLTKKRMPPALPQASKTRDRLGETFVLTLMQHFYGLHPSSDVLEGIVPHDKDGFLATLNTEKWMRLASFSVAAREVAYEMDNITPHMKSIFGEYPDIFIAEEKEGESKEAETNNEWLLS